MSNELNLASLNIFRCAKCKTAVLRTEYWKDAVRNLHCFAVECHGERQQCELSDYDLMHAHSVQIREVFGDDA